MPHGDSQDSTEQADSDFGLEILLPNHEELLQDVRREARGSHLRFKGAVASVADAAQVIPGLLGMVAAYALTEVGQEKDRWGSATNLARPDGAVASRLRRSPGSSFHHAISTPSTRCWSGNSCSERLGPPSRRGHRQSEFAQRSEKGFSPRRSWTYRIKVNALAGAR